MHVKEPEVEQAARQELVRLDEAARTFVEVAGAAEVAAVAFKDGDQWRLAGCRLSLCAGWAEEIHFQNDYVFLARRVFVADRWDQLFASMLAGPEHLYGTLGLHGYAEPLRANKWSEPGTWREYQARSLPARLPMLSSRRSIGPLAVDDASVQRLISKLEDTDFFDVDSVSAALGLQLAHSSSDHAVAAIEIEAPIRVGECRLVKEEGNAVVRTVCYVAEKCDPHYLRCAVKLDREGSARVATLSSTNERDKNGWAKIVAETPAASESEGAIVRLGYRSLSLLLPVRSMLRSAASEKRSPDYSPRVVVVQQVANAITIGPPSLPAPKEEPDENTGLQVGNWCVGLRIGKGSYGKVYKAEHVLTKQIAVVKLIDTGEAGQAERFRREASCLGLLEHPSIPRVLDAGLLKDERLAYIAQELLDGADLELARTLGWQPNEVELMEILHQATAPLVTAHEHGVVHRDIKPSNMFLEHVGDARRIRILDFGCAKLIGATKLTSAGAPVGAFAYQPPEAFDSTIEGDAASDVWSVGVTAYELLTGNHPFLESDYAKTFARIRQGTYETLDRVRFPIAAPVVEACLQTDRAVRPQDATALRDLIEACLDKLHGERAEQRARASLPHRGTIALWLQVVANTARGLTDAEAVGQILRALLALPPLLDSLRLLLDIPPTVSNHDLAVWATQVVGHSRRRDGLRDGFALLKALLHEAEGLPRV